MNYNEKVFGEQVYILRDFLFHYSSYKILHVNLKSLAKLGSEEFWVLTLNAHYFQAINLWCMVFGTDKNEIHWKKLQLGRGFKELILSKLKIEEEEYNNYWSSVTQWRNKYSAHRVPGYLEPTPDLRLARSVIFLYENWIRERIDDIINFSLSQYEEDFKKEFQNTINQLISH